jgi:putative ABC transport system permease protein
MSGRHRKDREHDWDRELRSHIDAESDEQQSRGLFDADARAAAKRAFGNMTRVTEDVRVAWGWMWFERFVQDVRYGLRRLRRERGFAFLAVLALALGIGATTVIFSVIDNVLLEPFPYRDAGRLTKFYIHDPAHPEQAGRPDFLYAEYRALAAGNHVFDDMIATRGIDVVYTGSEGPKLFAGYETTANTFAFFGVNPLLGRGMSTDDGNPGSAPVAVMSYRAWRNEFGSDPGIIGRLLTINGQQTTVIAVMPSRFQLYDGDFWLPLRTVDDHMTVTTMARLKPSASMQSAAADLQQITLALAHDYPRLYPPKFSVFTVSLIDRVVRRFRPLLYALMAAVGMLLLIACSNVANLLLARATARAMEIGIRASLGASRTRLILQLMIESFLLAAMGCAVGSAAAYGGIRAIAVTLPRDLFPNEAVLRLNGRVLIFAMAMAVVTTFVSGLAPALHAVGRNLSERTKASGKSAGEGARGGRVRSALVIVQVALSIVLLAGAGLMIRSLLAIEHVDLGFIPDHVLAARVAFPQRRYDTAEQKREFFTSVLQKIATLPGVTAAAETTSIPPSGGPRSEVTIPGDNRPQKLRASIQLCSDTYFQTMGMRILRGRWITAAEVDSARRVIVVNQTLAKTFFGVEPAIGRSIKFDAFDRIPESPRDAYFEIVGIAVDAKNNGLEERPWPQAFLPATVTGIGSRAIVVKTAVEPMSLMPQIKREVLAVDPAVPLTLTDTVENMLQQNSYAQPRFAAAVMALFAVIGLLLAAIGIFSVMAYSVSMQTHEIGIRMALGAQRMTVLWTVLRRGLIMIAIGAAVGEVASFGLTQLMRSQLWGVSPSDPLTLAGVLGVLVIAGVIACLAPAVRATRVDPIVALRYE